MGIAGQRLGVQHELAALAAVDRRRDAHLDPELIGLVGFSLADAFDLWRMQRVDLLAALPLTLIANLMGQRQRQGEGVIEGGVIGDLAPDIADNAAQQGSDRRKALFARLNCFA